MFHVNLKIFISCSVCLFHKYPSKLIGPEEIKHVRLSNRSYGAHVKHIFRQLTKTILGVTSKQTNSIFKDIIQIAVDPPASYPIFDKFVFDILLIMLTSLLPLEFLTQIMKF